MGNVTSNSLQFVNNTYNYLSNNQFISFQDKGNTFSQDSIESSSFGIPNVSLLFKSNLIPACKSFF